ncbi:22019_t:CDS:1, partial [Racocetra persica]
SARMNCDSTQTLTNKVNLDNKFEPYILVEDKISGLFEKPKTHKISFNYDDAASPKKTVFGGINCTNGFAAAIFNAYNYHKHLCLSPDDIWNTIVQGVSHHINYNLEKFRHRFVKHEGKKEIDVYVGDVVSEKTLKGDWREAVNRLVKKTDEHVEKIELKELLECNFSTTTSTSLTASRIVLLDTVKAYFQYKVSTICGIPKVTLEGTLDDWNKLQEKVSQLRKLNLELDFWLDRLEPVIWKLVETYRGEVDEDFWGRIININTVFGSGGGTFISGWMLAFFPYDRSARTLPYHNMEIPDIPDGMIQVPFTIDTGYSLKFIAGFVGANQEMLKNSNESVVSPVIGWFITDNVDDKSD